MNHFVGDKNDNNTLMIHTSYFVVISVLNSNLPLLFCPIHATTFDIVISINITIYFFDIPTNFGLESLNIVNCHPSKITEHVYLGITHLLPDALDNPQAQITEEK